MTTIGSIPSSSGTITIQENHLVELLKLVGESSQPLLSTPPTAPTQSNQDWLSQLVNVLKPTPAKPSPSLTPQLGAVESLMALMVEQLKKQQPRPEPTPPPNPAKELLKMLKVLLGEEPGEQGRAISIPKSAVKSRFCDWIAEYPFPDGQKVPLVVGTYDGTKDPEDHLALYDQAILTEKWVDPVACHLFPGTLQGHARDWFTGLPEKSIKDFQDLKEKFTAHFFQQKKHQRNHLEAHLIRQKENESLRDFILRFTQECQKIPGLPESQQISGFTLALHPGALQEKLTAKVPKTFKEAIDRAYDYLRSRETASLVRGVTKKEKSLGGGSSDREGSRHDSHDRQKRFSPYDKNALTVNLVKCPREILSTEKVCATFKPPSPMAFIPGKKNGDEYCEFHEDYGHDTNACKQLKRAINKAVSEGKLEHLVPGAKEGRKAEAKKTFAWQKKGKEDDDDPGPAEGHVCMIMEREQIHKGMS